MAKTAIQPRAALLSPLARATQCGQRGGNEEHRAVQYGAECRRPAVDQRFAALSSQLGRRQGAVAGDDERTHHHPGCRRSGEGRKERRSRPKHGAENHAGPMHRPPVKRPRPAPDHADGDEHQHRRRRRRQRYRAAQSPQRAGKATDQISQAPPRERTVAILQPGVKQKKPEQQRDANGNEVQGSDIKRCQSIGETAPHRPNSRRASVLTRNSHRFAIGMISAAGFAKALLKSAKNNPRKRRK